MRNSFIILAIAVFSMSIFSCNTSDIADEIGIEEIATEGEEGTVEEENED
ncbi:hypothetical protein [Aquimarina megaterium]|nr:hypothetical protein [Aquimarina megaterium]